MALKDLAYTAEEIEKNKPKCCDTAPEYEGPKYPWGLSLDLENATLEKLGIDVTKYKVGQQIPLNIIATVTRTSMSETEHGKNVSLGLTCGQMEFKAAKTNEEIAETLYDKKEG